MKKLKMSAICHKLGHDWPIAGSTEDGTLIPWFQCRRCGKINEKRRLRIVRMQQEVKSPAPKRKWYERLLDKVKSLVRRS